MIQEIAKRQKVSIYLVGGFLRDYRLGQPKNDFDFAVSAGALKLAKSFAQKIKGAYVLLDEERSCARVVKKEKTQIFTYDFAGYRAKTFTGDLAHRDFTINTLALDLNTLKADDRIDDRIIESKAAVKDIKEKRIRRTSLKALRDDPLRMLRAFSLMANLGFKIDKETLAQIKKEKQHIADVSYERIRDEFFKILESDNTAETLTAMDRVGLLEQVIPQVRVMFGCVQGGFHHLDVWQHSLEAVAQMEGVFQQFNADQDIREYIHETLGGNHSRKALMKLGCLLHDIGKPDTRKKIDGRFRFHGHERVGRDIVRPIAKLIKLSTRERHVLEDFVLYHLRPGFLSNYKKPSERMIYRFFRDTKEETAAVLLLSLADQRATRGPLTTEYDQTHHEEICLQLVRRFFDQKSKKPFVRLIDGNDLIKTLKLKPSPVFGKILAAVEEQQSLGKIKTKAEALELAEKIARGGAY